MTRGVFMMAFPVGFLEPGKCALHVLGFGGQVQETEV